ncbi:MAG: 4-hydroxy-tetrahydrodipicolinate reductase [Deltaproteobacteria bacterium]|nr:MAG: 4-hydroxy-tetrahydrodipicolinate reductase [Deltaproteobacteria bacterium]
MLQVAVAGASGRMGSAFMEYLENIEDVTALAVSAHLVVADDFVQLETALNGDGIDVIVDFSSPEASLKLAVWAAENSKSMVVGTTGFTADQLDKLADALYPVAALLSPNMSTMMNISWRMMSNAAKVLPHDTIDIEIVERHHRNKRNAPSSTALQMAQIVAEKRGWSLSESLRHNSRWGLLGERPRKEIVISSIRGGTLNSEHTIIFAGSGESLEVTHRSQTLEPFSKGALRAARWIVRQPSGVYDLLDMLGLPEVLF